MQVDGVCESDAPYVHKNWDALKQNQPLLGMDEYPLYTDAHLVGEATEGYGPYQFINLVPTTSQRGLVQPTLALRFQRYIAWEVSLAGAKKTQARGYHGGWPVDEIVALASLALGTRLRAADKSREFMPSGDPHGRPTAPAFRRDPVLLRGDRGPVLPNLSERRSLDDLKPITTLPRLAGPDAMALVRAARMYQDALWIAEPEPSLAWVMLVSAVETAAHHWRSTEDTAVERLKEAKPELFEILKRTGIGDLPEQVAECIADSIGATRKFIDFSLTFLPGPPSLRPESPRHCWDTAALRKTMRIIYGYRSDALHSGRPFPAPMCEPPRLEVPEEVPLGLASLRNDSIWFRKDTPLMLHVFEYIVRHSLLKWWNSMVAQP